MVPFAMKFQFRLKDGKTHEFTLPDAVEIHKAIVWMPKRGDERRKEVANFIILPDDVESVEVLIDD
jgi:hypothetical protein